MKFKDLQVKTFATLFSGGGGADCGLRDAGLEHVFGIERNLAYAAIANDNGFNTLAQDIRFTNWRKMRVQGNKPDWLHASPPCQRASVANSKQGESQLDDELARAVIQAVDVLRPKIFTLENVPGYEKFDCFADIWRHLLDTGYHIRYCVLDSADYGVPQNRKRLWLVANRIGRSFLPVTTHKNPNKFGDEQHEIFGTRKPWVGWDDAFCGSWPCESYVLSPRMIQMVPEGFMGTALMSGWHQYTGRGQDGLTVRRMGSPAPTVIAKASRASMMPLVVQKAQNNVEAYCPSVQNMAALQGFPYSYKWGDSRPRALEAIGNAVSPPIIKAIALANLRRR